MRRVWIEIADLSPEADTLPWSPSMRRVWIEIYPSFYRMMAGGSPSMRRVWIEISLRYKISCCRWVTLHAEGVD